MKLSEDYTYGSNVIRSYTRDSIEINDQSYPSSLVVGNTHLMENWDVTHVDHISDQHWLQLISLEPEIIIIGTGDEIIFPHPSSYVECIKKGIGVEFMDSGAACRTYNILLSEDRSVIAGIIMPETKELPG